MNLQEKIRMDANYGTGGDRLAAIAGDSTHDRPGIHTAATTDHATIKNWAALHKAEPATGEATVSGPAVRHINDSGAGIRFNFPGCGVLRPITWEEWFDHFDSQNLLFVYEEKDSASIAARAYARWQTRGNDSGHDRADWLQAERELQGRGDLGAAVGYHLVKNAQSR